MNHSNSSTSTTKGADRNIVTIRMTNGGSKNIDIRSIPANAWTAHHGTSRDGTNVRSIQDFQQNHSSSVLLRNSDDTSRVIEGSEQAIEVFCRSFLTRRGFSVTDRTNSGKTTS